MAQTIVDVHSLTSAHGWRFTATELPVAVFVLVSYFDSEYANLGPNKRVVALGEFDYSDDLVGHEISAEMIFPRKSGRG